MILVTQEARAAAEQARLQREGLVQAPAVAEKRRKKDRDRMPASGAHHAAEGAAGHVPAEDDEDDEDCVLVSELPGLGKGFDRIGITDGPSSPVQPGQASPQDFGRGYISAGHGALSPSHGPPGTPHVDLRGDRGQVRPLSPSAPSMPVEGPR